MLTIVARHRGMIAKEGLFGCASSADALRVEAAILVESTTRRCLSQIVAPLGERYSFRGMASSAGDPPLDRGSAADAEEFINSNLVLAQFIIIEACVFPFANKKRKVTATGSTLHSKHG